MHGSRAVTVLIGHEHHSYCGGWFPECLDVVVCIHVYMHGQKNAQGQMIKLASHAPSSSTSRFHRTKK